MPLVIVRGDGPTLFGRNWLRVIQLNWSKIHFLQAPGLQEVLKKYSDVFEAGLGTFKGQTPPLKSIQMLPLGSPKLDLCRMLCGKQSSTGWSRKAR